MGLRTNQEIEKILTEFFRGGMSVKAFCKKKGIGLSTFYQWKNKFKQRLEPMHFVPISVDQEVKKTVSKNNDIQKSHIILQFKSKRNILGIFHT
jgi:transposase-like protein